MFDKLGRILMEFFNEQELHQLILSETEIENLLEAVDSDPASALSKHSREIKKIYPKLFLYPPKKVIA